MTAGAATHTTDLGRRVLYSQAWEDVAVARAALRIRPGDTVLAVAAAGDNPLALLLDEPGRLLAVDLNPAQTALVALKVAALRRLPAAAVGPFLGAGDDPDRPATYQQVRPALPAAAATFWDSASADLRRGVIHTGRFERYLDVFRRTVLRVVPGRATLRAMLAATTLAEQRRLYDQHWDRPAWRALFRVFFSRPLLARFGRHPALFEHNSIDDIAGHYLRRCRHGLTEVPIADNPYVTYMIAGGYDRPERFPPYLQPAALARLPTLTDRLVVETADLATVLAALPSASVDAFYLSDIFELFDPDAYAATLAEVARVGRPGARLCYWNNLADRRRPPKMAHLLDSLDNEAAALYARDRVFIYSRFVVESVRAAGSRPRGGM
ncbi:MAG: DUF3419 family protein [Chloroflexi bacterium]|nr:DUF3419 family protein [Chloroflexota bacterium]